MNVSEILLNKSDGFSFSSNYTFHQKTTPSIYLNNTRSLFQMVPLCASYKYFFGSISFQFLTRYQRVCIVHCVIGLKFLYVSFSSGILHSFYPFPQQQFVRIFLIWKLQQLPSHKTEHKKQHFATWTIVLSISFTKKIKTKKAKICWLTLRFFPFFPWNTISRWKKKYLMSTAGSIAKYV